MNARKSSGEGDVNITGDEYEEEVPGNEKIKKDLDELNRMMKELWVQKNPGTEPPLITYNQRALNRKPNHFYKRPTRRPLKPFDDLYPYRTSRRCFPVNNSTNTTWPLMDRLEHSDDWLIDYKKSLDQNVEDLKNSYFPEQRHTYYNTEFKPHIDMPESTRGHHKLFGGTGIFFLMVILIIAARRWYNRSRPVIVLVTGVVPAAVQQHLETDMRPPGQGEAVPPYIEVPLPYSDYSELPPPYSTDTEQLINKNGLVETGFTNETCGHSDSGHVKTDFVSENGGKVEVHGTRRADGTDSVVFVDEKSTPV